MAAYGGTGALTGQAYGDLSANDAFTIQKRMLPIAKRLQTFAKFAQKKRSLRSRVLRSDTADMSVSRLLTRLLLKV